MFKKFSMVMLVLIAALTLSACDPKEEKSDSDVIREIRDSITFTETELTEDITIPEIGNTDVVITWVSSNADYLGNDGTVTRPEYYQNDERISLTLSITLNEAVVIKVFEFTILATDRPENIELNTNETDALTLDFAYETSDFVANGVGEVSLVACVDGDTAVFSEGGENITVRFLGIDTPESTAKFDPWGKAASSFTCEKLTNATTIVLQSDPASGRTDGYGRYLSWVWYDGRLLNLELVELAYSKAEGSSDNLYGDVIFNVNLTVQFSERRVWGEVDPDYDYSLEGIQISIEELVTNYDEYEGLKVVLTGIITRRVGATAFIQQGDYGIYIYNNISFTPDLTPGNEVILSGLIATKYPSTDDTGAIQVTNYKISSQYSQVLSRDNEVTPNTVLLSEITHDHIGSLLKVEELTVMSIYQGTDYYTLTTEDSTGSSMIIYVNDTKNIPSTLFPVGKTLTIVAPLSRHKSSYQLLLATLDDVTIIE